MNADYTPMTLADKMERLADEAERNESPGAEDWRILAKWARQEQENAERDAAIADRAREELERLEAALQRIDAEVARCYEEWRSALPPEDEDRAHAAFMQARSHRGSIELRVNLLKRIIGEGS